MILLEFTIQSVAVSVFALAGGLLGLYKAVIEIKKTKNKNTEAVIKKFNETDERQSNDIDRILKKLSGFELVIDKLDSRISELQTNFDNYTEHTRIKTAINKKMRLIAEMKLKSFKSLNEGVDTTLIEKIIYTVLREHSNLVSDIFDFALYKEKVDDIFLKNLVKIEFSKSKVYLIDNLVCEEKQILNTFIKDCKEIYNELTIELKLILSGHYNGNTAEKFSTLITSNFDKILSKGEYLIKDCR